MYNYKLTIQYDGGRYKGWQKLGDGENTIQGKLEKVFSELAGEETEVTGCSRTDAGVHALSQTANVKFRRSFSPEDILEYCSRYLPQDISVTEVSPVEESFHARYHARSKTYLYQIWNKEYPNPFLRKYSMHVPEPLNIDLMVKAGGYFIGEHDFTTFSNAKSKKKSMVRSIASIDIKEENGLIRIRVNGDGFLYNMVRKIAGVLIEAGLGKLKYYEIPDLLGSGDRSRLSLLAEAGGLFLEKIEY